MANDSTVKAGSWGARTVEKIIRIIERAYADGVPMVYLVDSAGARITDQVDLFPGRRGAGQHLLQPGARVRLDPAGLRAVRAVGRRRRLHPGVLRRGRDGRRQRLDVPRLRPHGRDGHRREDHAGGDGRREGPLHRVRASATSCARTEAEALDVVRRYLSYLPSNWHAARRRPPRPRHATGVDLAALVPASERQAFDMRRFVKGLLDGGQLLRDPGAVGPRADRRLRPAGRRGRRRGRATTRCSRAACCSSTRPTRRPGSCSSATRSTCRCCSCPTCPASWSARRWRSRASSGTAPR